MKKLIVLLFVLFLINLGYGKDKIYLKGGQMIKGRIVNLEHGKVIIERGKDHLEFTPEHIELIEFDLRNVDISKIIAMNAEDYGFLDGQMDAQAYHKRFGGNFALGLFFGVFGFIGVAVGNVQNPPPHIKDWETKMQDGDYIMGYDKKGKGKNMGAAGIGWAAGFILMLLIFL